MQDFIQSPSEFKGLINLDNDALEAANFSLEIDELITEDELRAETLYDFYCGKYEDAINKGFNLLDKKINEKADCPSSQMEADRISDHYVSPNGQFIEHSAADIEAELRALQFKKLGAMTWFMDACKANKDEYYVAQVASQILSFTNLYLKMIDQGEFLL